MKEKPEVIIKLEELRRTVAKDKNKSILEWKKLEIFQNSQMFRPVYLET